MKNCNEIRHLIFITLIKYVLPIDHMAILGECTGPQLDIMTSLNENIFRGTAHLCGEFTGDRWIPCTMASGADLLMFSLICAWINCWVSNGRAGDLRRHGAHYDVIVMIYYIYFSYQHHTNVIFFTVSICKMNRGMVSFHSSSLPFTRLWK